MLKLLKNVGKSRSRTDEEYFHFKNNFEDEKKRLVRIQKKIKQFSKSIKDITTPIKKLDAKLIENLENFPKYKVNNEGGGQDEGKPSFPDISGKLNSINDSLLEFGVKVESDCSLLLKNYYGEFVQQKEVIALFEKANNELRKKTAAVNKLERSKKPKPEDEEKLKQCKGQLINSQKRFDIAKKNVIQALRTVLSMRPDVYNNFFDTFKDLLDNTTNGIKRSLLELSSEFQSVKNDLLTSLNLYLEGFKENLKMILQDDGYIDQGSTENQSTETGYVEKVQDDVHEEEVPIDQQIDEVVQEEQEAQETENVKEEFMEEEHENPESKLDELIQNLEE